MNYKNCPEHKNVQQKRKKEQEKNNGIKHSYHTKHMTQIENKTKVTKWLHTRRPKGQLYFTHDNNIQNQGSRCCHHHVQIGFVKNSAMAIPIDVWTILCVITQFCSNAFIKNINCKDPRSQWFAKKFWSNIWNPTM